MKRRDFIFIFLAFLLGKKSFMITINVLYCNVVLIYWTKHIQHNNKLLFCFTLKNLHFYYNNPQALSGVSSTGQGSSNGTPGCSLRVRPTTGANTPSRVVGTKKDPMKAPFGDQVIYQNIVLVKNLNSIETISWSLIRRLFLKVLLLMRRQ